MKNNAAKTLFAVAIASLLIIVGTLSYVYIGGGQEAYSGTVGNTSPPASTNLAPDFTYRAVNGGVVSLSGLRGKVVVLDFMATWCQPCKDQIASLITIDGDYSSRGVEVISVNVDMQLLDQDLLQYRNQLGADWDFVTDSNGISMNPKYSVSNIPTIVIINKEGEIARRNVGLMSTSALIAAIEPLL